jgi:peroxiredoxin
MKNRETIIIFLLFFNIVIQNAQVKKNVIMVESKSRLNNVIDKATGRVIPENEIRKIIEANPKVTFQKVINEYGEVSHHIYDAKNPKFLRRDENLRVKVGEPILPFIMSSSDKKLYKSKALKGKIIILGFYFDMISKSNFKELINLSENNKEILSIIVTLSSEEEVKKSLELAPINVPVQADGNNFQEYYNVTQFPSFMVVNKEGILIGYFTDLDEVAKIVSKL